jgi:hypothetical protein
VSEGQAEKPSFKPLINDNNFGFGQQVIVCMHIGFLVPCNITNNLNSFKTVLEMTQNKIIFLLKKLPVWSELTLIELKQYWAPKNGTVKILGVQFISKLSAIEVMKNFPVVVEPLLINCFLLFPCIVNYSILL